MTTTTHPKPYSRITGRSGSARVPVQPWKGVVLITPSTILEASNLRSRPLHQLTPTKTDELRQRLSNANAHFRRKAADVLDDEEALQLLCDLYETVVINISEFDPCVNGIALSRLTAANFCEVGANVIFITDSGRRFVESIDQADE